MLIVMSGLPGTGKSAVADGIARATGAPVYSVDPLAFMLWNHGVSREQLSDGKDYEIAAALAAQQLARGGSAILDAVTAFDSTRRAWRAMAERHGTRTLAIECVCTDSELHRARLVQRDRGLPADMEPAWEEVQQREFEAWTEDRLVLDAVDPLDENIRRALAYVRA